MANIKIKIIIKNGKYALGKVVFNKTTRSEKSQTSLLSLLMTYKRE